MPRACQVTTARCTPTPHPSPSIYTGWVVASGNRTPNLTFNPSPFSVHLFYLIWDFDLHLNYFQPLLIDICNYYIHMLMQCKVFLQTQKTALSLWLLMDDEHNNYGLVDHLLSEGSVHLHGSKKNKNIGT